MKKKLLILGIVALILLVATGVFVKNAKGVSDDVLSQCISSTLSQDEAYLFGEAVAYKDAPLIDRRLGLSCDGGLRLFFSSEQRSAVSAQLVPLLITNPSFREGTYAGLGGTALSRLQRQRLGQLGRQLELNVTAQLSAVRCEQVAAESVAFVSQLDLPFATSVLGIQLNIKDPLVAQQLGEILISKIHNMLSNIPETPCSATTKDMFSKYAENMLQFSKGNHPWAPGCGVGPDDDGLRLKCIGITP